MECCLVSVDVRSVDCVGMVAKHKIDDSTNLSIWECFCRYCILRYEVFLVDTVTVYGLTNVLNY